MQAFLLGLSNGTSCLSSCGPYIIPYFMFKQENLKKNYIGLMFFLVGRYAGYMLFAVLVFIVKDKVFLSPWVRTMCLGISYCVISSILLYSLWTKKKSTCLLMKIGRMGYPKEVEQGTRHYLNLIGLGVMTGINICPPFILLILDAINAKGIMQSILIFSMFFMGTSLFFLPIPFVSLFSNKEKMKIISKQIMWIVAIYYLIKGMLVLIGGAL